MNGYSDGSPLSTITISAYAPGDPKTSAELGRRVRRQLTWVKPMVGDLTSANADALIISANNWLSPGSGNARFVYDRGGTAFKKALKEAKSKRKSYRRGTAITLPGGSLVDAVGHRRFLIHAVTTLYEKGKGKSRRVPAALRDVYWATRNALKEAKRIGARSVAVSLMCARPGYHILQNDEEAPFAMARAIMEAINDLRTELFSAIEQVEFVFPSVKLFSSLVPRLFFLSCR